MSHFKTLTTAAAIASMAVAPASALAASSASLTTDAAMRKGIRDAARIEAFGAKVSQVHVTCGARGKIGHTARCTGTFRLTRAGRSATYRLTPKAGVFNNSPGSLQYRVSARADHKVKGLPGRTDLAGFLQ